MSEIYIVLAQFEVHDAPVFKGTRRQCRSFCERSLNGAQVRRKNRDYDVWRTAHEVLRENAKRILHRYIDGRCISLVIVRMRPEPIDIVDYYDQWRNDSERGREE